MNRGFLIFFGTVILLSNLYSVTPYSEFNMNSSPVLNQTSKGVVLIDDNHDNDYETTNELQEVVKDLSALGFLPFFTSEFGGWKGALQYGHYMIITTPTINFTQSELDELKTWFENGTRSLLLSSRGDFGVNAKTAEKMNALLDTLGSSINTQDDNVYTTDPAAPSEFRPITSNILNTIPKITAGVSSLNFFSPSSVRVLDVSADIIVYGDPDEYQTDQNDPAPVVIFDDTNDGAGGDSIPLVAHEEKTIGSTSDRIVVTGTTLWSNFNYNSNPDNIKFFQNTMGYFYDKLIEIDGSITIEIPDLNPPEIFIRSPRDDSVVKGTITIEAEVNDVFGVDKVEIFIDNELKVADDTFSWDTTLELDSEHLIKVTATDVNDNVATLTHTVMVNQSYIPQLDYMVKVMTYNIEQGGLSPRWFDVMKEENADIAILVETPNWDDDNSKILDDNLDILNGYFVDEVQYTGVLDLNAGLGSGVAILSRFPIISSTEIKSVRLDNGEVFIPTHDFLQADIQIGNREVSVIATHLKCCTNSDDQPLNEQKREKSQEGIINHMDNLGNIPIIFAGDMNSEYPDESKSDLGTGPIEMLVNPSNAHSSEIHTFTDVHKKLRPNDIIPTHELGARIDFIFVNQFFDNKLISTTTGDTPSALGGSDHSSVDVIMDLSSFLDVIESEEGNDGFLKYETEILVFVFLVVPIIAKRRREIY